MALTMICAIACFIFGLGAVLILQSESINEKKLIMAIESAERMHILDESISFARAIKLYAHNGQFFSVFDSQCQIVYSNDLKITKKTCIDKDPSIQWIKYQNGRGVSLTIGATNLSSLATIWRDYSFIILITVCTYSFFVFLLLQFFLLVFVDLPIKSISKAISHLLENKKMNDISFKKKSLFSELYSAIYSLINEIAVLNREENLRILSKQIAHDIKAPIQVLNRELNNPSNVGNEILNIAIKRMTEISNSLLKDNQSSSGRLINFQGLLSEIANTYSSQITINTENQIDRYIECSLDETTLYRYFSNLIKNSIEAGSTTVNISVKEKDKLIIVQVLDNGRGSESKLVNRIIKGFSNKHNGNGLGISHISNSLKLIGGEIDVETSIGKGFKVELRIPYELPKEYILIDDDKLIRLSWKTEALKKNISFQSFEYVDQFLNLNMNPSSSLYIYIDSNLGDGVKGEIEAKRLELAGYTNIYLATGYTKDDFDLELIPWIKGVTSKTPPF